MPIHEFRCSNCEHVFDVYQHVDGLSELEMCPMCGEDGHKIWTAVSKPCIKVFKPHWNENISPDGPIYIESKRQLKKECERRNLSSQYVEDSYNRSF